MPSFQYKKSHYGDKTVVRSSYLHNGISFTGYMRFVHKAENNVILVHSMEVAAMPTRDSWESQTRSCEAKCNALKAKFTQKLKEHKVKGRFESDIEKPGELICSIAKQEKATMVVMGTRGMGKLRRTIMGSVSDYVVHHADCPVLVCRQSDDK